ncbi:MAG: S1C family serine protease [Actinomycetota bacterium]
MAPAGDLPPEGHGHDDEDGRDEEFAGGPPHPLDRLWLHPTELATRALPRPRRAVPWAAVVPLVAGLLGAVITVAGLAALGAFDDADESPGAADIEQVAAGDAALARVVDAVGNGLVLVTATDAAGPRRSSGVCLRHRGEILTSARTVGDAQEVTVRNADGETMTAIVAGRDLTTDLALIVVDRPLHAVPLAETTAVAGDSVWVVGARPSGTRQPWISGGIVASTDALVASDTGPTTAGLLESDALATAWAAGGALIDRTGAVTGIVVAPTEGRATSYAVPIDLAVTIARALREAGEYAHGSLGVVGIDTPAGPTVTDVPPESAAARAGLAIGDIVTSVAGDEVINMGEVMARVRTLRPGRVAKLEILRAGAPMTMDVELSSTISETAA